ncbi:MAG: hypothetical protein ACN4GG_04130 [Akkermansiaceae bacterium]
MITFRFCFLFISLTLVVTANKVRKQEDFQIFVQDSDWKYSSEKLHQIFKQAGGILWRDFPEAELPPIEISYDADGPIALFGENEKGHKRIKLSSQESYWSQHIYQFSHEFCHLLVVCQKGDRSNHWFEEAVCEMASIYVIGEMAKLWKTNPAISGAEDYANSFANYAKDYETRKSDQLPEGVSFQEWFQNHQVTLRKSDGYRRDLNGVIALQLLPHLKKTPSNWGAFHFLNVKRRKEAIPFKAYLANWRASSPKKYHPFIDQVVVKFGL